MFVEVYRALLRADLAGERPNLLTELERAGFRVQGDRDDAASFIGAINEIVRVPLTVPLYDWGESRMITELKSLFLARAAKVLRIRPPAQALLFYRSAVGLAQDFRLLRCRFDAGAALASCLAASP